MGSYAPKQSPYADASVVITDSNLTNPADRCAFVNYLIDQAYPYYRSTIDVDLRYIQAVYGMSGPLKNLQGLWGFLYVYYQAWRANAEFSINGYKPADDYALLTSVTQAWNKIHAGTSTYTFQPVAPPSSRACLNLYPGLRSHYPNLLIDGDVDGVDKPPVTINLGPRALTSSSLAGSSSGLSTGAKVAIGAGVAAGGAALGVGLYALITKQGYSTAWDRLVRTIAKPFR